METQCANALPTIYGTYQKGLPDYYSLEMHKSQVCQEIFHYYTFILWNLLYIINLQLSYAIKQFSSISRGPGVIPWIEKLAKKCERYWKNGHQQCETRSILGNICCEKLHQVAVEDNLEIAPLPEL